MTTWVDAVIIVFVMSAALWGWQRGAARQVLGFAGLWVGLVVGAFAAPEIASLASANVRGLLALVLLVLFGLAFSICGELVGGSVTRRLRRRRLGAFDRGAGVLAGAAATLLAFWLFGNLAANTNVSSLDRALQDSAILRGTNRVLPTVPEVFTRIQRLLSERGIPLVFANLPPTLDPVTRASTAEVEGALAAAGPSTLKVSGPACGRILTGSGFVVAPGLVITNAHVIAGDLRPQVSDAQGSHRATPILFDPRIDVAVLSVPGLGDPVLHLDTTQAPRGTTATVLGYPGGANLTAQPAGIDGNLAAVGFDIYNTRLVTRDVYQLNAHLQPGDSGGPLVEAAGSTHPNAKAIGLVFARSLTNPHIGYALTAAAVDADLHDAEANRSPVSTGSCTG